ncbi:MAG: TetR/AcrR family transcriptional regulator [Deltaproteobacteria bacterium]|nr:TetR/AcrR family transcriptional regulator [Deltaproteobacteria bacterium]
MPATPLAPAALRHERRARARAETRQRICDAAMRLFVEEGFEQTSMRRIADAVGYTPGALYAYFEDKDEILYALLETGFTCLREAMQGTSSLPPRERLLRVGEIYLRFAIENPHFYELMFIMSNTKQRIQEQEHWQVGIETYEFLRSAVRAGMDAGVIPRGDAEAVSFALWSNVHGIASLLLRGRTVMIPDESLPALVTEAYRWLLHAAMTHEQRRPSARPGTRRSPRRRGP